MLAVTIDYRGWIIDDMHRYTCTSKRKRCKLWRAVMGKLRKESGGSHRESIGIWQPATSDSVLKREAGELAGELAGYGEQ